MDEETKRKIAAASVRRVRKFADEQREAGTPIEAVIAGTVQGAVTFVRDNTGMTDLEARMYLIDIIVKIQ